jgi:integrase
MRFWRFAFLAIFILTFILTSMASVVRRTKSRFWTACFTSRDGRQLKRSTKTTVRSQAMQIALELERVERQAQAGALTTAQLRKVLNDVSEKVTGDNIEAQPVEAYLNEWLKGVEARNRGGTFERYENTVRLFVENLGDRARLPVTSVTPLDIERFLSSRLKTGVAPKTAVVDLKTLNTAFRRAEAYGLILKNPVAAVRPPKVVSSERAVFTHAEVERLLEAAPSLEWQTLILLGYFVGARLSDCVRMSWDHVRPETGIIEYHQQKTGKKVVVPMHYHVIEHLNFLSTFGTHGFLCPKLSAKGPGGKHGLSEGFKRIVVKAGIDPMTVPGKGTRNFTRRTFHSLRHSFNSALANAGVAEEVRMKLTGHSSKAMNSQYTHLEVETLKNAVSSMPVFGAAPAPATGGTEDS